MEVSLKSHLLLSDTEWKVILHFSVKIGDKYIQYQLYVF